MHAHTHTRERARKSPARHFISQSPAESWPYVCWSTSESMQIFVSCYVHICSQITHIRCKTVKIMRHSHQMYGHSAATAAAVVFTHTHTHTTAWSRACCFPIITSRARDANVLCVNVSHIDSQNNYANALGTRLLWMNESVALRCTLSYNVTGIYVCVCVCARL